MGNNTLVFLMLNSKLKSIFSRTFGIFENMTQLFNQQANLHGQMAARSHGSETKILLI